MFIPNELLPSFFVIVNALAGILWIVGLRKVPLGLISIALMSLVSLSLSPFFEGMVAALPIGLLALLAVGFVFVFAGRFLRDVAVHVCGDLLVGMIRWTFASRAGFALFSIFMLGSCLWSRF